MESSPETLRTRLLNPVTSNSTPISCDFVSSMKQAERDLKRVPTIYFVVAVITVILSIIAMIKERNVICYVAFSIPLFTAPYAIFLCRKMIEFKNSYPFIINEIDIRKENLNVTNQKMYLNVNKLQNEINFSRKQKVKDSLDIEASKSGVDCDELLLIAKENRLISEKIVQQFKGQASQIILQILLECDADENFEFTDDEIETIIVRFSLLHFCDVDVVKFRSALRAIKGKKEICFGTLAKDIFESDLHKYGISFQKLHLEISSKKKNTK